MIGGAGGQQEESVGVLLEQLRQVGDLRQETHPASVPVDVHLRPHVVFAAAQKQGAACLSVTLSATAACGFLLSPRSGSSRDVNLWNDVTVMV